MSSAHLQTAWASFLGHYVETGSHHGLVPGLLAILMRI